MVYSLKNKKAIEMRDLIYCNTWKIILAVVAVFRTTI